MTGAGELDQRITLVKPGALIHDGLALVPGPEAILGTVWARRRDISDRERLAGNVATNRIVARFLIRWRSDLTPDCVIEHGLTRFEIIGAPKEIGRRQFLEITAGADA